MSRLPLFALGLMLAAGPSAALAQDMTVWHSPTCGCCHLWARHVEAAGFRIKLNDVQNVTPIKRTLGVRPELESCHTARIEGYTIEGHVPARDIRRLLAERPDAVGLSVPGMPSSAPGMDVGAEPYQVLLMRRGGSTEVFASYN